jgi:hypothetical protein
MSSEERERSRGLMWVVWLIALMPLAYVLSVGPVVATCDWAGWDFEGLDTFYAPLDWLCLHTPLKGPLKWYVRVWGIG